jgi:hypothetical protein
MSYLGQSNSVNVKKYGARGDAVQATASMTGSDVTLASGSFTNADLGKKMTIPGAGVAGVPLLNTINSVSGGIATMVAAATTPVTNVTITYGTQNDTAFTNAQASGLPVIVPIGGYYITGQWATLDTGTQLRFIGEGPGKSIIYHPSTTLLSRVTGSHNTSVALTANATVGDTSITVTSTSTFKAGDWLRLRAEDAWDSVNTGTTKKGEIVRIDSVTSGTVLALSGRIVDSYTTANSAAIEKINYSVGHRIEGFTFQNTTPDYSSGGGIQFYQCADGLITNCSFKNFVGAGINLNECRDFNIEKCRFSDGYALSSGSGIGLGYGVAWNEACVNCWIDNSVVIRGHGICTTSSGSTAYGVPRHCGARNCQALFFYNQPFHTHQQGEWIKFINCVASNGSPINSGGFTPGFGIYAKKMTVENCVYENSYGDGFFVNSSAPDALLINPIVRTSLLGTNNATGIRIQAANCTVLNPYIDTITDTNFADNVSGVGVRVESTATNCQIFGGYIKNTSGHGISTNDTTDSCIIDGTVLINNGLNAIYANGFTPSGGKWRNIRTINSGSGTTNQPVGIAPMLPNHPGGATLPGWGGDMLMTAGGNAGGASAGRMYCCRFVPSRDMKIGSISYWLSVNSGSNDALDVAVLDISGNRLASAGPTTGKTNTGAGGWVSVSLSANYILRQGQFYWICVSFTTPFGGTAPDFKSLNLPNPMGENLGTGTGQRDTGVVTGVGSTIGTGPHTIVQSGTVPLMKVNEV